jgi:hypothetical protein
MVGAVALGGVRIRLEAVETKGKRSGFSVKGVVLMG